MTWFISVLIAVGIILAIALYVGFIKGKEWAEITVLILVFITIFVVLVMGVHSIVFG